MAAPLLFWLLASVACQSPSFEFDRVASGTSRGGSTSVGGGAGGSAGAAGAGGQSGAGGQAGAQAGEAVATSSAVGGSVGAYDTGAEDCLNGADDDDDGNIDCADTDCSPYFRCVPQVPEGWQGPIELWQGIGMAPACDHYFPVGASTLPARLLAPPKPNLCPECSCASPDSAVCGAARLEYFADAECNESLGLVDVAASCSSQTIAHNAEDRPVAARFAAPQDLTIGCEPVTEGTPESPPAELEKARACGQPRLTGLGCQSEQHCLPRPLPPFAPSICIHKQGEFDCPDAFPEARPRFFRVTSDGRFCRPCLCGTVTCRGNVNDSSDDLCGSTTTSIGPGQCTPIKLDDSAGADTRSVSFDAEAGASCASTGPSQPDGEYTLSNPVSYCCLTL